jgi:tetratricopeptide (TPR) repeat protein
LHHVVKEFFLLEENLVSFEKIEGILEFLLKLLIDNNIDVKVAAENRNNLLFFDIFGKSLDKIAIKSAKVGSFFANLGTIYYHLGIYKKVEIHYLKSIDICEEILGDKHPDTATSSDNLSLVYIRMGN